MSRKPEKKMNFEEALRELEKISVKLSEGDLPLEESVKLFEKGMELKKICSDRLNDARKKIKILVEKDGNFKEEDFLTKEDEEL